MPDRRQVADGVDAVKWKLVKTIRDGHRFFENLQSHRISVCDDSGHNPSTAADGPVYVDNNRHVELHDCPSGLYFRIPVLLEGEEPSYVSGPVAEVRYVMEVCGMKLDIVGIGVIGIDFYDNVVEEEGDEHDS